MFHKNYQVGASRKLMEKVLHEKEERDGVGWLPVCSAPLLYNAMPSVQETQEEADAEAVSRALARSNEEYEIFRQIDQETIYQGGYVSGTHSSRPSSVAYGVMFWTVHFRFGRWVVTNRCPCGLQIG